MVFPLPRFEYQINVGTILEAAGIIATILYGILQLKWTLKEHPPHSHYVINGGKVTRADSITGKDIITYPAKSRR